MKTRFRARKKLERDRLNNMQLWGIRLAIVTAIVTMNIAESIVLRPLIRTFGLNLETTLIDEFLLGLVMGFVVCCIHEAFRRRYEAKLKAAVDELNHHVRNSMQVIINTQMLCPQCGQNTSKALQRVDWALKEILPSEIQPE